MLHCTVITVGTVGGCQEKESFGGGEITPQSGYDSEDTKSTLHDLDQNSKSVTHVPQKHIHAYL